MIFKGSDGALLYGESHFAKKAIGSLLVVHGLGEHLGRYQHLVQWALGLGLNVHLMDLRGHGRSQGVRGHASDFALFRQDLSAFIQELERSKAIEPSMPNYIFAHSMGGLIALDFIAHSDEREFETEFKGLMLSSPALGLPLGAMASLQSMLSGVIPAFLRTLQFPSGIDPNALTHDQEEVEKLKKDPICHTWITPALFSGMVTTMERANDFLKDIRVPTLFLLAGRDAIVDVDVAERFAKKLSVAFPNKIKIRRFHSFFHEVVNEKRRDLAFREMEQWILSRLHKKKKVATRKSSSKLSGKKATEKANLH